VERRRGEQQCRSERRARTSRGTRHGPRSDDAEARQRAYRDDAGAEIVTEDEERRCDERREAERVTRRVTLAGDVQPVPVPVDEPAGGFLVLDGVRPRSQVFDGGGCRRSQHQCERQHREDADDLERAAHSSDGPT